MRTIEYVLYEVMSIFTFVKSTATKRKQLMKGREKQQKDDGKTS